MSSRAPKPGREPSIRNTSIRRDFQRLMKERYSDMPALTSCLWMLGPVGCSLVQHAVPTDPLGAWVGNAFALDVES